MSEHGAPTEGRPVESRGNRSLGKPGSRGSPARTRHRQGQEARTAPETVTATGPGARLTPPGRFPRSYLNRPPAAPGRSNPDMSATIVATATTAAYLALAAAGSPPPWWMWTALVAVNGTALTLAARRRVSAR